MKVRLLLLLLVAFVAVGSAAAADRVPNPNHDPIPNYTPQMPTCDPGDDCSGHPPDPPPPPCCDPGPGGDPAAPVNPDTDTYSVTDPNSSYRLVSTSGCNVKKYTLTQKSWVDWLTGGWVWAETLWKLNVQVSWCWNQGTITSASAVCYPSDISVLTIMPPDSCTPQTYYYNWSGYNAHSGFYALASAQFSQCVFHYQCFSWSTSNVELFVHSDGSTYGRKP